MGRCRSTTVSDVLSKSVGAGVYNKYPDISDRDRWDSLSVELKNELIKAGEKASKEPWTQLLISDFLEFSKSGNRVRFEDKYFPRRQKLNNLVMAECAENKGRFVDDILDGLYLILEETTWCLPPHTSYVRDAKQEKLPDVTRQIIDLFQAETGAEVAFCEYLMRPVFDRISPFIGGYVNERLRERIFTPYLNQHFWWMGNGEEPMCNWTPWCTQNVLISALSRREDFFTEAERRVFLEKAAVSCDYFLDEYGEDGCCNEGAQYYSHAGLCLFGCLELIDYSSGRSSNAAMGKDSSFATVYKDLKIRNVATYIMKMHACGDYYINFADCSALPGRRTAREFLFGKAIEDEVLQSFAAADFRNESVEEKLILEEINLFYHCMQVFAYDEMKDFKTVRKLPENAFFESTGLLIARNDRFVLAAKAGNNGDSHNHNDVGSYTIYKDGKPFVIDLGVGTYTQKTFSDRRYELWTMQSQYHNLPTFVDDEAFYGEECSSVVDGAEAAHKNPHVSMQKDGASFGADAVEYGLESNVFCSMDIAGAYGDDRIRHYIRKVSLGEGVTVSDHYEGSVNGFMSIMTYEKPELVDSTGSDAFIKVGELGTITYSGFGHISIEEIPVTDERLKIAWKHDVYRIVMRFDATTKDYEIRFND